MFLGLGIIRTAYVSLYGKLTSSAVHMPVQVVFHAAQKLTGVDFEHTIMVGDSLHHDIKGAASVGMQSVFVAGGIHANDLDIPPAKVMGDTHRWL